MLDKVEVWEVPTPDHVKLKEFCINQLNESMEYGFTDEDLDKYYPLEIAKPSIEEWLEINIGKCEKEIEYHTKEWEKEVERTNERNNWINQLKDSLK